MGISQRQEERSTLAKGALTMGLPRPNPFEVPTTPEQALSDYLLHAGIAAGTLIGVYAYTGLYAGPGHAGMIYMAFFSTAEVGAAGAGSVALTDTMYAMSVYAEPFVAAARFVAPIFAAMVVVAATAYVSHKVVTATPSDPYWDMLQSIGRNISMSAP